MEFTYSNEVRSQLKLDEPVVLDRRTTHKKLKSNLKLLSAIIAVGASVVFPVLPAVALVLNSGPGWNIKL